MTAARKATYRDIPRLLALYNELDGGNGSVSVKTIDLVFSEFELLPNQELLVAENEGLVVGTLFLKVVPNLNSNARPHGLLRNMIVDKRHHRRGIGVRLVERAFTSARKAGCEVCYKDQSPDDKKHQDEHGFYRYMGFEDSKFGLYRHL